MSSRQNEIRNASIFSDGIQDSKSYRRFVATSSVDKTDNTAVWNSEMNEAFRALKTSESAGVQDRPEKLPAPARAATAVSGWAFVVGIFGLIIATAWSAINMGYTSGRAEAFFGILTLIGAGAFIVMKIFGSVYSRNAWVRRMQAQDAQKESGQTESQT